MSVQGVQGSKRGQLTMPEANRVRKPGVVTRACSDTSNFCVPSSGVGPLAMSQSMPQSRLSTLLVPLRASACFCVLLRTSTETGTFTLCSKYCGYCERATYDRARDDVGT